eukprot:TRINITY_DN17784_c0_g1_i1.p2 TRINITY_DN17784_c0_g1~~TRINITY_DN17784_c0_g1_i1.p2  ORF type:complete len:117 (+),score=20.16 TRINITY_DN17784_c0_g1_i1:32-352(+)
MAFQPIETRAVGEYATEPAEDEEWYVDPVTGERGIVKKAIIGGLLTGVAAYGYKKYKEHNNKKQEYYCPPPQNCPPNCPPNYNNYQGPPQGYYQGPPQGYYNGPPR